MVRKKRKESEAQPGDPPGDAVSIDILPNEPLLLVFSSLGFPHRQAASLGELKLQRGSRHRCRREGRHHPSSYQLSRVINLPNPVQAQFGMCLCVSTTARCCVGPRVGPRCRELLCLPALQTPIPQCASGGVACCWSRSSVAGWLRARPLLTCLAPLRQETPSSAPRACTRQAGATCTTYFSPDTCTTLQPKECLKFRLVSPAARCRVYAAVDLPV